jgi:hypothetical protein
LPNTADDAILRFPIGYESVEILSAQAGTIKLAKSSEALEEVVVTALGIKESKGLWGIQLKV